MKEALKLALEFLEDNQHYVADNERHVYVMLYNEVIEKCKAALAKQDGQSNFCAQCEAFARELKAVKAIEAYLKEKNNG
jgi:nicotinamide riboside kinase